MAMPPFVQSRRRPRKVTPDEVDRQRQVALALMGRGADFSPAKGGFYEALGRGLQGWASGRMNKLAREAEAEGMSAADERWQQLSGALGQSEAPAIAPQGFGISEPTYSFPQSLIESESGGNWGALNSEGYGGRLQFGASRLADAANAGVIPAGMTGAEFSRLSPEMQQSVERWHFSDIDRASQNMGLDRYIGQTVAGIPITQDGIRAMAHLGGIGGAAKFLNSGGTYNPADSNGTRLSDYALRHGGSGGSYTQPSTQNVGALAAAMGDPWFAKQYGPVAEALMGQQMQMQNAAYRQQLAQQDPAYQLGLEKARLELDAMRNPGPAAPVFEGGQWWDVSTGAPTALTDRAVNPTSLMQNLEAAGYQPGTPEYNQAMTDAVLKPGVSVNVGDGAPGLGKLSSDYGYVLDPQTREPVIDPETGLPQAAPVPGSPAAQAIEEAGEKSALAKTNAANYARTVTQDIGVAGEYLDGLEGGFAGGDNIAAANLRVARAKVPGTAEYNMQRFMDSALSNVTLDTMNRMRESSPAGATGFGNMSEKQMAVIQGVLGNWDPGLPVQDQRLILHRLGNFYLDVQLGTDAERAQAVRDGRMTAEENDAIKELYYPETRDFQGNRIDPASGADDAPPEGISAEDWEYLTPEEKALFR